MWQLRAQDGGLNGVETKISAYRRGQVLRFLSVYTQQLNSPGQTFVVRQHHSRVPVGTEVLRGKEAETSQSTDRTGAPTIAFCTDRLGSIFDHGDAVSIGDI